jgi:hypothetical protein
MLQPIGGHLFVQDRIVGIRRIFQDEKKPQAQSGG